MITPLKSLILHTYFLFCRYLRLPTFPRTELHQKSQPHLPHDNTSPSLLRRISPRSICCPAGKPHRRTHPTRRPGATFREEGCAPHLNLRRGTVASSPTHVRLVAVRRVRLCSPQLASTRSGRDEPWQSHQHPLTGHLQCPVAVRPDVARSPALHLEAFF